jgi:alkyl sulfatase BDS1-like metallo-beta-lactamase superfamily hydrolase
MFRDPREWRDGLKLIRELSPAALVNTHAQSIKGKEAVAEALNGVIDGLSAILDQTIRGILRGLGPDDLRTFVRLPAHLANLPNLAEIYGEISHFGPYLYNAALGWFDGDAATINPLPPADQATRLVEAMGGPKAVLSRAKEAFVAGDFAWAAQLVDYLYRLDPTNHDVRLLKAEVLQQMGRVTPAHTVRSWYVSQARALRGEVTIPRLVFANTRVLALAPPAESMDQYRVRIDPEGSAGLDIIVAMSIIDPAARHAWHLRRGVVEFVADAGHCQRPPEVEIATDYDNWLRFFACKRSLEDFLDKATITNGSRQQAHAFFNAFDFYARAENSAVST